MNGEVVFYFLIQLQTIVNPYILPAISVILERMQIIADIAINANLDFMIWMQIIVKEANKILLKYRKYAKV